MSLILVCQLCLGSWAYAENIADSAEIVADRCFVDCVLCLSAGPAAIGVNKVVIAKGQVVTLF